ncbi:MAG: hypothetical protein ACLT9P_06635 [Evtepia gabavorous]
MRLADQRMQGRPAWARIDPLPGGEFGVLFVFRYLGFSGEEFRAATGLIPLVTGLPGGH